MIVDFREAASGATFEADVCVIGAGAAGIAIARELKDSRHSVLVLESGGLEPDDEVQALHRGTNTGGGFGLDETRVRMLGGTTAIWDGWCAPLHEIDFTARDWVPYSGWPITRQELMPFYERAQRLCGPGPYAYELSDWPDLAKTALALDPEKLETKLWQVSVSPARFGEAYTDELRSASNLTVLLHATATEIVTGENAAHVAGVRILDLDGRAATVRARVYILACGGIETPRLMLASNRIAATGLGNDHDRVGRFFMEHPHADSGGVFVTTELDPAWHYVHRLKKGRYEVAPGLGPSAHAQQRLRILNSSVVFRRPLQSEPSEGWDSLVKFARAMRNNSWPDSAGTHIYNILRDVDDVVREGYGRVTDAPVRAYTLVAHSEVAPNPANRISLVEERDALGMNRVRLRWTAGMLDRVTVQKTMTLLAEELGRLQIGRVRINELLLEDSQKWIENLDWFGHHLGTTRMSADPRRGVVDPDCRVHGIDNLYVASGSVFPTGGYADPTLTIVALAVRLADHVRSSVLA